MITIGFPRLDGLLNGLAPGSLTLLAGQAGVGKSNVMLHIFDMAGPSPLPRLFVSTDLPGQEIQARRQVASRNGGSNDPLAEIRVYGRLPFDRLREVAEDEVEVSGLAFLLVDSVSLLDGPRRQRYQQILEFVRQLKNLAMDLDLPMIGVVNQRFRWADLWPAISEADTVLRLSRTASVVETPRLAGNIHLEVTVVKNLRGPSGRDVRVALAMDPARYILQEEEV